MYVCVCGKSVCGGQPIMNNQFGMLLEAGPPVSESAKTTHAKHNHTCKLC